MNRKRHKPKERVVVTIDSDGTKSYRLWWKYGPLHRLDGPAISNKSGNERWAVHGKLHRLDGPAKTCFYSWSPEPHYYYYINGEHISPLAFPYLPEVIDAKVKKIMEQKDSPQDTLASYVKSLEEKSEQKLDETKPIIIRLDGVGFSKLTKRLKNPFHPGFKEAMDETTKFLCNEIQGVDAAYTQSDEITLVLNAKPSKKETTSRWFDGRVQKICSVAASKAATKFMRECQKRNMFSDDDDISFDARMFSCDPDDIIKVLMWRQADCIKNSISKFAGQLFSSKELLGVSGPEKIQRCIDKRGKVWSEELSWALCNGTFFHKELVEKTREETGETYMRNVLMENKYEELFRMKKEFFASLIKGN